jgi:hypothetical protein
MNMFKTTSAETAEEYIDLLEEPRKTQVKEIHQFILKTVPKLKPFIISGMIGYGKYRYKSKSGREGDWSIIALASQKNYISIYACGVKDGKYVAEMHKSELPKADIGKSCIRIKKIEDVDLKILEKVLKEAQDYPMSAA